MRSRRDRDSGQILPLVTGFTVFALLLVLVTVDVTALHLQRQELHALTDAAALDAADALDEVSFYANGAQERPVSLSSASVHQSVLDYLREEPGPTAKLRVGVSAPTGALDGSTAEVTLAGRARVPLISLVVRRWAGGVPLQATSRASAREVGP